MAFLAGENERGRRSVEVSARRKIYETLKANRRLLEPSELANVFNLALSETNFHLGVLAEEGRIRIARTVVKDGAEIRFYEPNPEYLGGDLTGSS